MTTQDTGDVVAAYLGDYAVRQRRTGNGLPFRAPMDNALTGLLYLRVLDRIASPGARAAADHELSRLTARLSDDDHPRPGHGRQASPAANVAGYVWAAANAAPDPAGRWISWALEAGRQSRGPRNLTWIAWRTAFLAAARGGHGVTDTAGIDEELDDLIPRVERAAERRGRTRALEVHAQVILALSLAGRFLQREDLRIHAATAVETAASALGIDDGTRAIETVPSRSLASLGVAADAAGHEALAGLIARTLLDRLLGDAQGALVARSHDDDRSELRPWVPLMLVTQAQSLGAAEAVLDPSAPPLPAFRIVRADFTPDELAFDVELDGRSIRRSFDTPDLDLMLDRVVAQLEATDPAKASARQYAHVAISAMVALGRIEDADVRAALERLLAQSMAEIVRRQHDHGGWPFGRKDVLSVSYTAARGRSDQQFADLEYTIDAAVPGIALSMAHRFLGGSEYLAAADRAFAYFENVIGRIEYKGQRMWRLWPEDTKTTRMGTAVNYELWNACFFAAYSQITTDPEARRRTLGYIEDAIDYADRLTTPDGDIAYGDYVRELRTAYASWDAFLLAAIGSATGNERATRLSQRIVERLGGLLLPSGAMPNVVDHEEPVGDHRRLTVHRHGIGAHPVRAYYQLYFVIAAVLTGRSHPAARRALGYVLLELYDKTLPSMSAGTKGDGTSSPASAGLHARDWLVLVLSLLGELGAGYRPSRGPMRPMSERLLRTTTEIYDDARARSDPQLPMNVPMALACASLARTTGSESWAQPARHRAVEVADEVPHVGRCGEATRLLLEAHGLRADPRLLESARQLAADAAARAGDIAATIDALDAASAIVPGAEAQPVDADGAARLAEQLLSAQDAEGWWEDSRGQSASLQARALTALLRYHRSGPPAERQIERAVRRGARIAWKTVFRPTGQLRPTGEDVPPIGVDDVARFAWLLGQIAALPGHEEYGRFAHAALRQMLHTRRTATGGLAATPGAADPAHEIAGALWVLAELTEQQPAWLE